MGLWSKFKKASQKASAKAYKKKKQADQVRKSKGAASSSYDDVRKKATPKVSSSNGSSGSSSGRSSGRSSSQRSTWGSTSSGSSRGTSQSTQKKSDRQSSKSAWQAYVDKTFKSKRDSVRSSAADAYKKYKAADTNALGVKAKTHTGKWGNPVGKTIAQTTAKVSTHVAATDLANQASVKAIRDYERESGQRLTNKEKEDFIRENARATLDSQEYKDWSKQNVKKAGDAIKGGTFKAKDLSHEDFLKMQNALRLGGGNAKQANRAVGNDLAKKIGSMTAYSANRNNISRASHQFMQGMSYGDVEGGIGKYGENELRALHESRTSKAGTVGYMGGFIANMALGGVGSAGKSIAGGVLKSGAKGTAKSASKKFLANRAGELAAETPMNLADAAKMAKDENGKVDTKAMLKYMGLNTAMTAGMGGLIEGVGVKLTRKNADDYIALLRKESKGGLTEAEQARKLKLKNKIEAARRDAQAAKSSVADVAQKKGKDLQQEIRVQRKLAKNRAQGKVDQARLKNIRDEAILERKRGTASLEQTTKRNAELAAEKVKLTNEAQNISIKQKIAGKARTPKQARAGQGRAAQLAAIERKIAKIDDELRVSAEVRAAERKLRKEQVYHLPEAIEKYGADSPRVKTIRENIERLKEEVKEARAKAEEPEVKVSQVEAPAKETTEISPRKATVKSETVSSERAGSVASSSKAVSVVDSKTGKVVEDVDKRISELRAEKRKEKSAAAGAVNHKNNAVGKHDQAYLDNLQAKADAHDARQVEIQDEIDRLTAAKREVQGTTDAKPVGFDNLMNDKDVPKGLKESRPEGTKTPSDAPTVAEAPPDPVAKPKISEPRTKLGAKLSDASASFIRKTTSSLYGFERAAAKLGDKKLQNQITQVYLVKNRLGAWIQEARSGLDRKISGKALDDIFKDAGLFGKKNQAKKTDFNNYLIYKHAIDRLKVDKPVHMGPDGKSLYTADDYQRMMDEIWDGLSKEEQKQLQVFEKDISDYFKDLMQYRVDTGLVSKDLADNLAKRYPSYVPTYRDGDDWLDVVTKGESYQASIGKSIKTATGGQEPIQALYNQMVKITADTLRDGEENVMVNMFAKAHGFSDEAIPKGTTLDDVAAASIHVSQGEGGWRVTFFHDGEPVTMAVDKQIAKGLKEFNGMDYGLILNGIEKVTQKTKLPVFSRAFKSLITDWNVLFGVRNGARDFQQALVNSKNTRYFIKSYPATLQAIASKDNAYMKLYEANGGKFATLVRSGRDYVEPGLENVVKKGAGKVTNTLEAINGAIEIMPRMAEFIGTLNKHADDILKKDGSSLKKLRSEIMEELYPGRTVAQLSSEEMENIESTFANRIVDLVGKDSVDEAMRNSADITLNFSRNGAMGKVFNSGLVPYLNPSIQGLSKTIRLFTEGKADKALLNIGMKLGTFTIAPAVFNELALKDNKDYQSLNTREKDANFFISIGDGKFIKVPKPRENAVLAEPFEYGLRYFFDKAQIGAIENGEYSGAEQLFQMWDSAVSNIGPVNPITDNLFSPIVRLFQNKTWYGGSIESVSDVLAKKDKKLKNSEISDERTSFLAIEIGNKEIGGKKVSDILHASPKKIDDFLDSYLGMIYDFGIGPRSAVSDGNPIVNQFVKDSVFSNKRGTELWSEFERANAPDTLAGEIKLRAKKKVFGNTASTIQEKTLESKDWLNQKGYDDMTYSAAITKLRQDKSLSEAKREELARAAKRMQNDLRTDLVYGSKVVTPGKDPIRKLSTLVGIDKALEEYTYTYKNEDGKEVNQHRDAWRAYKQSDEYKANKAENSKRFLDLYTKMRYANGQIGESKSYPKWMTASILCAAGKGDNDDLAKAYIRPDGSKKKSAEEQQGDFIQRGKNYIEYGNKVKEYIAGQRDIFLASRALGNEYVKDMQDYDTTMALATSKKKHRDGAYYSADTGGYISQRMNYGRCLATKGYTTKQINKFAKEYDLDQNKSGWDGDDWKAYKEKTAAAVRDKYGNRSQEEQAAIYHVIVGSDWNEPFGQIGDYSQKNDTGVTELDKQDGYGGRRRRGRRRRRRRGYRRRGYGRGGSSANTPDWYQYVDDLWGSEAPKTKSSALPRSSRVKIQDADDFSHASRLNDAYRKRASKRQMITKKS